MGMMLPIRAQHYLDKKPTMEIPHIADIQIDDDLSNQEHGAIEVTVTLSDNSRRWCCFMTPAALQACGDWIDGTQIRLHYGTPHMIVISGVLTEDLIRKALLAIEKSGKILDCTKALDSSEANDH